MKTARFVLKIVGASLSLAGAICLLIGFWDKLFADLAKCGGRPKEYDDYADVD
jgi:hypothetical protein